MAPVLQKRKVRRVREVVGIDQKKASLFDHLPVECVFQIFSYNPDPSDRWSCAAVCKKWLLIQAHMKRSDFKRESPSQLRAKDRMKRCLEGGQAVDTRIAAMAVRKWARGIVGDLSIRGDFLDATDQHTLSSSSSLPQGVTDCGLDIVGSGFPCLKSLALWGCLNITNKGLVCVSRGCALLEKLDLCECPLITDDGMVAVASGLKRLTTLSLDSCRNVGDVCLKAFGSCTPSLHSLSVKGCRLVGHEGVFAVLAGLPNLKRLKLAQLRLNMHPLVLLALVRHFKNLTSLSLEGYSYSYSPSEIGTTGLLEPSCRVVTIPTRSNDVDGGNLYPNLRNIAIKGCQALSDKGLLEIGQKVLSLEKLSLESCQSISSNGLIEFLAKYARNLKKLSLAKCSGFKSETYATSKWRSVAETQPPSCHLLESLAIASCDGLGDGFLGWIGSFSSCLREVELISLRDVSDGGVQNLLMGCDYNIAVGTKAPVERVILNGCSRLTDMSVLVVCHSFGSGLKTLGISHCPGMTSQSLKIISFYCRELRDLDVSGNEIKCGDLAPLNKMIWLSSLNLKSCPGLDQNALASFESDHFECDLVY